MEEKGKIIEEQFSLIVKDVLENDELNRLSESFNTKDLPDVNYHKENANINFYAEFNPIFRKLDRMIHNCIYWFSFDSIDQAISFNNLLNEKREELKYRENDPRVIPTNNGRDKNSNVLYVGVRRGKKKTQGLTHICGRIIQHFGYYVNGSTQGLQLVHLAQDLDYNITLNVVELEHIKDNYLNVIEKLVADELNPLCGRH